MDKFKRAFLSQISGFKTFEKGAYEHGDLRSFKIACNFCIRASKKVIDYAPAYYAIPYYTDKDFYSIYDELNRIGANYRDVYSIVESVESATSHIGYNGHGFFLFNARDLTLHIRSERELKNDFDSLDSLFVTSKYLKSKGFLDRHMNVLKERRYMSVIDRINLGGSADITNVLFAPSFRDKIWDIVGKMDYDSVKPIREFLHSKYYVGSDKIRNVTINSGGMMTFLPQGKKVDLGDYKSAYNKWKSGSPRQETDRYGRTLRKIFKQNGVEVSDSVIEHIHNTIKSEYYQGQIKIVDGADIKKYYHENMYSDRDIGNLRSSCMRYAEKNDFFSLYVNNPEVCKMAVMLDERGCVMARAILWETDRGYKVMDRIYASDSNIKAMQKWAEDNGYYWKGNNSYGSSDFILGEESIHSNDLGYIELKKEFSAPYPYLDTFCYGGYKDGVDVISAYQCEYTSNYEYTNEDGDRGDGDVVYCDYIGESHRRDEVEWCESVRVDGRYVGYEGYALINDTVWSSYHQETILESDAVLLYDGTWVHMDVDVVYAEDVDGYVLLEDAHYCEYSENSYLDNVIYVDELDMSIHKDHVEEAMIENGFSFEDGEWVAPE